jgi:hypothetical protein
MYRLLCGHYEGGLRLRNTVIADSVKGVHLHLCISETKSACTCFMERSFFSIHPFGYNATEVGLLLLVYFKIIEVLAKLFLCAVNSAGSIGSAER